MPANSTLLQQVAEVVKPGESFLVTLSGGADSVALLAVLALGGHRCRAIHCNYHLRGEESDRDERHARETAARLGVDIDVIQCNVAEYQQQHPGESVEMACRALRYAEFDKARQRYGLDSIAIGHHIEDNIETMLLNMLRGSGIKGLAGMRPRRGVYVRPLLQCTKTMILDYLDSVGLSFVTDSSNLDNKYRRNALRNDIIPAITRYYPDALQRMSRTMQALSNQRDLLDSATVLLSAQYVTDNVIDLKRLAATEPNPVAALFELLNTPDYRGFNIDTVKNIISRADCSGLTFTGDTSYYLDHGKLIPAEQLQHQDIEIIVDIDNLEPVAHIITGQVIDRADFHPQRDHTTAYFDIDKLRDYHCIKLRHPRAGDYMRPWGMNGKRLLSDIFTDMHATRPERLTAWVLEADGNIMWLVGIRAANIAPVTDHTTGILCLHKSE